MCAEEQDEPGQHLSLEATGSKQCTVEDVRKHVTQLLGADDPVDTCEGHPLIRKVLHKYARPYGSRVFSAAEKLPAANSKAEKVAELPSPHGTPPAVRACTWNACQCLAVTAQPT